MTNVMELGFEGNLPSTLIREVLTAYQDARKNFYLGGLRLSGVEGGRFCEAVFRILEFITTGDFTPLGRPLETDKIIARLANLPAGAFPDSVRLNIPRALRVVYDIRNGRDVAHLGDDIDPNIQDATLVVSVLDWVLAELVRLYHKVTASEALLMVNEIVQRKVPAIQEFSGFLKCLNPELTASERVLVLLYHKGERGASLPDLNAWVGPSVRPNLKRTLYRLEHEKCLIYCDQGIYKILISGEKEVEVKEMFLFG